MSKQFSCQLCDKEYSRKGDLTRHMNSKHKDSASSLSESQKDETESTVSEIISSNDKNGMIGVFKGCLNILRDSEALTGDRALRSLSHLLVLKLFEKFTTSEKFKESIEFENIDDDVKELFGFFKISNLLTVHNNDFINTINGMKDSILSIHCKTSKVFLSSDSFGIKKATTFKALIEKIDRIDINSDHDVLGNAYEEVIKDLMTGKVLGQFFTQPELKQMMVKLIDPQIFPDGTIETCADPTMGTGGFLITYMRYIKEKAKTENIEIDWDFITREGLYGKEIDSETYKLAMSNMLISSDHLFDQIECGDSLREPINRKFDIILANPPFGIKGIEYSDFAEKDDYNKFYCPIKSNNAISLFIQAIICMLKVNGRCAVIIPDGQDLHLKTNKTYVAIREYLMKTCDLKEIIYLPRNMFQYASVKTCVLYFIKKVESDGVVKSSVFGKSTKYNINLKHQTTNVKFYSWELTKEGVETKKFLADISIDDISKNSYSLNYLHYEKLNFVNRNDIVYKKLGEICEFSRGPGLTIENFIEGEYPVVGGGKQKSGTHNEYNTNENVILCSRVGNAGYISRYNKKVFRTNHCFSIVPKNEEIDNDYLFYYLKSIQENIYKLQHGSVIPNINSSDISDILIPILPINAQNQFTEYSKFIIETLNETSIKKIAELKKMLSDTFNLQCNTGNNDSFVLGEICEFSRGPRLTIENFIEGEYPVVGGGKQKSGTHNEYNTNENVILCSSAGNAGYISRYDKKVFKTDSCFSIVPKNEEMDNDYLFYYLKSIQENIYKLQHGSVIPGITPSDISDIQILIPKSASRRKDLINQYEKTLALILSIEDEIKVNEKMLSDLTTEFFPSK